jgi:hypothetical protein
MAEPHANPQSSHALAHHKGIGPYGSPCRPVAPREQFRISQARIASSGSPAVRREQNGQFDRSALVAAV